MDYINNYSMNKQSDTTTGTISFILEWLSLRRRGQDVMHTPLGYVCQGRPLDSQHAFFVTNRAVDGSVVNSHSPNGAVTEVQVEDHDSGDENWYDIEEGMLHVNRS
jgi:hypothetical protein